MDNSDEWDEWDDPHQEEKECLLSMVKDKFGNYVVQKLQNLVSLK